MLFVFVGAAASQAGKWRPLTLLLAPTCEQYRGNRGGGGNRFLLLVGHCVCGGRGKAPETRAVSRCEQAQHNVEFAGGKQGVSISVPM